jgi:hypothetical protein
MDPTVFSVAAARRTFGWLAPKALERRGEVRVERTWELHELDLPIEVRKWLGS